MVEDQLVVPIPCTRQAPGAARHALAGFVREHADAAAHLDALLLLVSELVTNAITHPQPEGENDIELSVAVTDALTRVVVNDQGTGFAKQRDPFERGGSSSYGLMLLDAEADRWGTLNAPGRFSVWFEIDHVPTPEPLRQDEDEEPRTASPPQP
jgi:anti-sigma regulatory factor (Ser/Thr protein kinase)